MVYYFCSGSGPRCACTTRCACSNRLAPPMHATFRLSRTAKYVGTHAALPLRVFVAAWLAIQMAAQTNSCIDRAIPVNVYTERGDAVKTLTAGNFKANISGKRIQVTAASYESIPRRIVILIDVSGSMAKEGRLKWGLEFAQNVISLSPSENSLALLTFSNQIEDSIAFYQARTAMFSEIEKLRRTDWERVKGIRKTALRDAIFEALALLEPAAVGDAIYLISDGGENASRSHRSTLEALLEAAGVRVFAFLPTWRVASRAVSPEEAAGLIELRNLTIATGGELLPFVPFEARHLPILTPMDFPLTAADREELKRAAQNFHTETFAFSKLNVTLPQPLENSHNWSLDVVDSTGLVNKQLQIMYPHRLAPCTP